VNHCACEFCWTIHAPEGRTPVRVLLSAAERLDCCFCGQETRSGIFVRLSPHDAAELRVRVVGLLTMLRVPDALHFVGSEDVRALRCSHG
jgi:hypothetical protein